MKKLITFLSMICLSAVLFSCSKSDDPADNDIFVGTYKGSIGYKSSDGEQNFDKGSVTVAKVGDDYYFRFSDGIEDLSGVKMQKGNNNLINIDLEEGLKVIRITASTLIIKYSKDGKTWTANASR